HLGRCAMRGPARMRDTDRARRLAAVAQPLLQLRDLPHRFADIELAIHEHADARRVIAAVLQSAKPFDQQWRSRALTDIADNATHMSPCIPAGRGRLDDRPRCKSPARTGPTTRPT